MKKVLSFVAILFAMLAVNAQYTYIMQESFEGLALPTGWVTIDADGDGFNWAVMDQTNDRMSPHTGDALVASASYDNDGEVALTPDNWLITTGIAIPADANQPTLSWWVSGQDANWAEEHYAVYISTTGQTVADFSSAAVYEGDATGEYVQQTVNLSSFVGQTIYIAFRHYNITNMFFLNIDDIEVYTMPTEPTLSVNPTSIDFGTVVVGQTSSNTAQVNAFNLTGNIAISTQAPFAVSLDGSNYTTSVSMPAAGGTLYVQFAPTSVNAVNETVTLTSGSLSATISLTGSGFECTAITTFPYTCTFDPNAAETSCWQTIDANGDGDPDEHHGQMWFNGSLGTDGVAQYFYNDSNTADDWLISPEINGVNLSATFDYSVASATYAETFGVYVIPQGGSYTNATELVAPQSVTNTNWQTQTLDLSAYDNQTFQLAIHVTSDPDMWYIIFDNFTITGDVSIAENTANTVSIYPNPATSILNVNANGYNEVQIINMLGQVVYNTTMNDNAQINVRNLNDGVYFVRLNGANGTTTQKFIKK